MTQPTEAHTPQVDNLRHQRHPDVGLPHNVHLRPSAEVIHLKEVLRGAAREGGTEIILLALVTLAALTIPLLPLDLVSNNHSMCIFKMIFGRPCPGCGMTRAFWALFHGDINSALAFNWKIILVAPILGALYFYRAGRLRLTSLFND